MRNRFGFHETLEFFIRQRGYSTGQLARLTGIPKATIANWRQGRVAKPRNVEDLLKLAATLHLEEVQTSHLLNAANYPSVSRLRSRLIGEDQKGLLAPWSTQGEGTNNPPFQAIADLPYFVGREAELHGLQRALMNKEHPPIHVLHGMGGVGKTTLTARLAYQLRAYFHDGVLWASLGSADVMSTLMSFAHAFGHEVADYGDLASRSAVIREILADKHVLIVLDNAKNVEQIRPLLPPTGPAAVLITTRNRQLGVSLGAKHLHLTPFEGTGNGSLELFGQFLGEGRVQQEGSHLAELADLLGHLPLAIAVAASRLASEGNWTTDDFLRQMRNEHHRLDALVSEDQSVRLSFNLSFEALSPEYRRYYSALGVIGGEDFNVEAAAQILDIPLQEAAALLRKFCDLSLLQMGRPERYRLHPLLRGYACGELEDETFYRRAVTYFFNVAESRNSDYETLNLEFGNLKEALAIAHEQNMPAELVRGVNSLFHYFVTRGHYEAIIPHLNRAIEAARIIDDPPGLARALRNRGQIARILGDYIKASANLQESLKLAGEIDDEELLRTIIGELVLVESMRADFSKAKSYFDDALDLIKVFENPNGSASVLLALGLNNLAQGESDAAEPYLEMGLKFGHLADHPLERSFMLMAMGMTKLKQGDYEEAETHLEQTLTLAEDIGYGAVSAAALMGLAIVKLRRNQCEQATSLMEQGLDRSEEAGQSWAVGRLLNEWGDACLAVGQCSQAEAAFEKSLALARETSARALIGEALFGLARLAVEREDLDMGHSLGQESLAILRNIQHYREAEVDLWLARVPQDPG